MPFLNPNGSVEGYILTKTKKQGWKKIWIRTEGSMLLVHKERAVRGGCIYSFYERGPENFAFQTQPFRYGVGGSTHGSHP